MKKMSQEASQQMQIFKLYKNKNLEDGSIFAEHKKIDFTSRLAISPTF